MDRFMQLHTLAIRPDYCTWIIQVCRGGWTVKLMKLIPLTPNDLQRRRAVSPLKIKIPSKNMREKSTNTPIIH
jgi:hypothetical protein